MLSTDKNGDTVRHNEAASLWAVKRGSPQWASWVNWYHYEFGKNFFPDWLTVPLEWPPTTDDGAATCAKWLSDIRDSKYLKDTGPCSTVPVRARPGPWSGAKHLPKSPPCSYPGIDAEAGRDEAKPQRPRLTVVPPEGLSP